MKTFPVEISMRNSSLAIGLLLAMSACEPDLPHTEPVPVVSAVFDPTTAQVPLPNDLAFLTPANSACPAPNNGAGPPACAQAELIASFNGQFPSDQEVPITIDFTLTSFDAGGKPVNTAPDLDLTTFTPDTFLVAAANTGGVGEIAIEPLSDASYTKSTDGTHGTLTIHNKGRAPWPSGQIAAFVRGGAKGVKTKDGSAVSPSQVFDLIAQGVDMSDPKNQGLLRAQLGSAAAAAAQGAQLELIIKGYQANAFPLIDGKFPHQELAVMTTFTVAPLVTNVTIDPARGLAPLPIDLLADAKGHISLLAACTFAGSTLSADGTACATATATAQAAGFTAIDGFSTTGAILGPTSELVDASTINPTNLQLWELPDGAAPIQVPATAYIAEPCEFSSSCPAGATPAPKPQLSPVIAIQPAGASANNGGASVFLSKPLKEHTTYAVVMTTDILDKASKPIGPGTVAKILRFTNPLVVGGKSQLSGIDDATASGLEAMRQKLAPLLPVLAAGGVPASKIAMAYTFHTQSFLGTASQLASLPYAPTLPAAAGLPGPVHPFASPDAAFVNFGATADDGKTPATGTTHINEIFETDITTFNLLDPATGAFNPDPTKAQPESIHVLVATPTATTNTCPLPGLKCAPMVIFHHGLTRGRADMLLIAEKFASAGMVTVAIDAAKHGDRTLCTSGLSGTDAGCADGVACNTTLPPGAQGDANPPGTCAGGALDKVGVNKNVLAADGIPKNSGKYLVSANFFRTRDTMRQDIIDQSQLVHALAFVPGTPNAQGSFGNTVFDHMAGGPPTFPGIVIDPSKIYFIGQSLGAIEGAVDVATNPRITKAVLNVGGGTITDVFTNSPSFQNQVNALLQGLGIDKAHNPAGFLQFLTVAKTVLDPADPINYVGHLTSADAMLPDFTKPAGALQAPKSILTQMAFCDQTVPNPFNFLFASNVPTGPLPTSAAFFTGPAAHGTFQLFTGKDFTSLATCVPGQTTLPPGAIPHGFLLSPANGAGTATGTAQDDAAAFLFSDTQPLVWEKQ